MHLNLETLTLRAGPHAAVQKKPLRPNAKKQSMSLLEATAFLADEPLSENPSCVDPLLAYFAGILSEELPDRELQQFVVYVPQLIGTQQSPEHTHARAWVLADRYLRRILPLHLERVVELRSHASNLRALPEITDQVSWDSAQPTHQAANQAVSDQLTHRLRAAQVSNVFDAQAPFLLSLWSSLWEVLQDCFWGLRWEFNFENILESFEDDTPTALIHTNTLWALGCLRAAQPTKAINRQADHFGRTVLLEIHALFRDMIHLPSRDKK